MSIDQAKAKCRLEEIQQQRAYVTSDETQEVPSQDLHHSAEDLYADVTSQPDTSSSPEGDVIQVTREDNDHADRRKRIDNTGLLKTSRQKMEQYLADTHSGEEMDISLGECSKLSSVEKSATPQDSKEPSWMEMVEVMKKAGSGSALGPSGIPYKVYKMCPKLLRCLWRLVKVIWRKGKIPECWQTAEWIFVPKEKNSANLNQFRTMLLLSVEGKIFFAIPAMRMTTYMTSNEYIDSSILKGGIPGFPGCIEHTSADTQLIREAKINHGDLIVIWLGLSNAYGSIPHQLIFKALEHYRIPEHIQGIIRSYFSNIRLRFTVGEITTTWQALEKGIVTGCTISVIFFVMGINLIIKAADRETRGHKTSSGMVRCTPQLHQYRPVQSAKLQLTTSPLVEEWKVAKARLVMPVRVSKDQKIRSAGIDTRTGRKWSASTAVQQTESALRHSDFVGTTCKDLEHHMRNGGKQLTQLVG
ncbi:uncharacterized protein LOC110466069 [Mizuhopecten yessoensis]|uniref:uncharacterized protein LOC110466069 n=1 Tax=Mizuhopecten yessoensis TaxID=6573 RepID=UPI000B458ED3|nr:uncharacterized protein LOC110466069 [Mizuhopecten yessoensis]